MVTYPYLTQIVIFPAATQPRRTKRPNRRLEAVRGGETLQPAARDYTPCSRRCVTTHLAAGGASLHTLQQAVRDYTPCSRRCVTPRSTTSRSVLPPSCPLTRSLHGGNPYVMVTRWLKVDGNKVAAIRSPPLYGNPFPSSPRRSVPPHYCHHLRQMSHITIIHCRPHQGRPSQSASRRDRERERRGTERHGTRPGRDAPRP
jgi:hypothetical protein